MDFFYTDEIRTNIKQQKTVEEEKLIKIKALIFKLKVLKKMYLRECGKTDESFEEYNKKLDKVIDNFTDYSSKIDIEEILKVNEIISTNTIITPENTNNLPKIFQEIINNILLEIRFFFDKL